MAEVREEMRKIAFDLDGVVCSYNPCSFARATKNKRIERQYYLSRKLKINPTNRLKINEQSCIITGRPPMFRKITEEWLARYGLLWMPLYMVGNDFEYRRCLMLDDLDHWDKFVAFQKAYCLQYLGVSVYYEDKKVVANIIKKVCPNLQVRMVK